MRLVLLLFVLALAGNPARAAAQDCGSAREAFTARAYAAKPDNVLPLRSGWSRAPAAGACRIWPAHPDLTLLSVPIWQHSDEPDARNGDVEVLVVDSADASVKAWTVLRGAADSDAVRFEGVSLDTARYRLDAAHWTFGIRTQLRGSSGPNPYAETRLVLIAYAPGRLQVLTQPISMEIHQGEWDTRCAGEFDATTRTLEVDQPRENGFADLIVRERAVHRRSAVVDGSCEQADAPAVLRSHRLRHDGRSYPLLDALSPY